MFACACVCLAVVYVCVCLFFCCVCVFVWWLDVLVFVCLSVWLNALLIAYVFVHVFVANGFNVCLCA